MMYYKIYERKWGNLIAVCDKEVCDKTFKEGDIDFFVNPRFYKDKEGDEDKILSILKNAASANLVGKKSVNCGIKAGLVDSENVIEIQKVPHAQSIVMTL